MGRGAPGNACVHVQIRSCERGVVSGRCRVPGHARRHCSRPRRGRAAGKCKLMPRPTHSSPSCPSAWLLRIACRCNGRARCCMPPPTAHVTGGGLEQPQDGAAEAKGAAGEDVQRASGHRRRAVLQRGVAGCMEVAVCSLQQGKPAQGGRRRATAARACARETAQGAPPLKPLTSAAPPPARPAAGGRPTSFSRASSRAASLASTAFSTSSKCCLLGRGAPCTRLPWAGGPSL